jgi:hypothetical protein
MTTKPSTFAAAIAVIAMVQPLAMQPAAAAPPSAKPAPAPAQRAAPATTINCLIASNVFAQRETDANKRDVAKQTLYFYLGRLDPRMTASQLGAALKRASDSLKGASAAPLMNACLHELQTKSEVLQMAGQQAKQAK